MRPLLPFLSLLLAWAAAMEDPVMPFKEYLDSDRLVSLKWGFDEVQGTITFALCVNATGWVGFGLSPNGGMAGSDIVIGGIGPNGNYFTDRHATGNTLPVVDKEQNYTLLSLTEDGGQTIMTFQRFIQSCDDDDFHITAQPIKLIYAYGTTDEIQYHAGRRGTKEVNLLKYMPRSTLPGNNYFNVTVDNIAIPPLKTYYHCKVMKFPKLNGKHHIYRIEPVIEHQDIVHHMLLYRCPPIVTEEVDQPCYLGNVVDICFQVVAAWAVGGGVFELPENAGIPIDAGTSDILYRLEIHYSNPTSEAGRRDSSGLRMYYTAQLRQHDVGVLNTGLMLTPTMYYSIPPNATEFHTYGTCNTSLISKLQVGPVPDLQVFAVLLHTHLAGRKIRAGLFRNGKQIDFLGLEEHYNFDMQQITNLGSIKTIKPGDEILVECTYSTTNRTDYTVMGLATTDEMCLVFLFYYPALNIDACWSHPDMSIFNTTSGIQMLEEIQTSGQDPIPMFENLLKTIPQIQVISNLNISMYPKGTIGNMMKTPSADCSNTAVTSAPNNLASRRLSTSWVVAPAGTVLLLLWTAVM